MTAAKVWFITGAGRGIGAEVARAALAAGAAVVATGRDRDAIARSLGTANDLLVHELDVTRPGDARSAVQASLDRFGRIDVLLNNAGYGQLGFFEELSPSQVERQIDTNLIGPMNVTRAVLPAMRERRSGHVISISSVAGLIGAAGASVYAASKFAVEGWMEALHDELAPLGIGATVVEPGYFRTDFLDSSSIAFGEVPIDDYSDASARFRSRQQAMNRAQPGDPAKLAEALLRLAEEDEPPVRFAAGADAVAVAEMVIGRRRDQIRAWRDLSESLAHDDA